MKHWHRCDRWERLGIRCPFQGGRGTGRDPGGAGDEDPEGRSLTPEKIGPPLPPIHQPQDRRPGQDIEQEVMDLLEEIRARDPAVEEANKEQEKVGSGEPVAIPVPPVHTPARVPTRGTAVASDPREGAPGGFIPAPVLDPDAEPIGVRLALGSSAVVSEGFRQSPRTVTSVPPVRSTVRRDITTRVTRVQPSTRIRRVPGAVRASLAEAAVTQELQEQLDERREQVARMPVGGGFKFSSLAAAIAAGAAVGGGGAFMFNAARRMRGLLEGSPARQLSDDGNQGNLPNEPTE